MAIPRIIHHVWVGSPVPDEPAAWMESWRRLHPTWVHRLWRDDDLGWLTHRDLFDRAPGLVPVDAVGQLRADIARYEILARHGGLYVDCDTEALRPVDEVLTGVEVWAAMEDDRWVGNTYLASTPGHRVMQALVSGIPGSVRRRAGQRPNTMTGPQYLTPLWRSYRCPVSASRRWFPYSYRDVRNGTVPTAFGDAYAVHHWQHTRDLLEAR
jgi:inositol phosphorylceramide mannosyltransferase catalytic subunit